MDGLCNLAAYSFSMFFMTRSSASMDPNSLNPKMKRKKEQKKEKKASIFVVRMKPIIVQNHAF
jgi:hypothetical protein